MSRQLSSAEPWIAEAFEAEGSRVLPLLGRRSSLDMAESTEALVALAARIIAEYERLKRLYGRYDFEDLILRTRRLLVEQVSSAWVLYKLDGGIDHILIDEAQDTNPEQWEVMAALADEFFSGSGARDLARTIFAVGDVKQSIFSFQRADPAAFERMRAHFAERIRSAEAVFAEVPLTQSFRSAPAVLSA